MKRYFPLFLVPLGAFAQEPVVPVLNVLFPDLESAENESQRVIALADYFGTEEINDKAVRLTAEWRNLDGTPGTTNFDFLLFKNRTPITSANFLGYVNRGDYESMVVHRLVKDFVVQGGGFRIKQGETGPYSENVPTQPPIQNEFGVSNTLATISMAKLGGDPDSATSQWFVSTGANSDNLDFQNGGFTVFGRVSKETFPNVMALNNAEEFTPYNLGGVFNPAPLVTGTTNDNYSAERFFRFSSATEIPLPEGQAGTETGLSYSLVSQSGNGFATGTIVEGNLVIEFPAGLNEGGEEIFVVQAEDSVGNQVVDTFKITNPIGFEEWRGNYYSGADLLDEEISGPLADPNGDGFNNFELFVLGLPAAGNQSGNAKPLQVETLANGSQVATLEVRKGMSGVEYVFEKSEDLKTWSAVSGATRTTTAGVDRDVLKFNFPQNPSPTPALFYRVRFTQPTQ